MILLRSFLVLILFSVHSIVFGQSFANGDLDGVVDFVSIPTGWQAIPFTEPFCQAPTQTSATVDIVDDTGPSLTGGVVGYPYNGVTFCSGLHAGDGVNNIWHEGIMQVVNGFTIGNAYTIDFYQTVLKQENCLDESGSWRVYIDGVLIATSLPSTSNLSFNDLNLIWDNRQVSFVASANSHNIQFIPWDDDGNITTSYSDVTGAIRMGIDNISFVSDPLPTVYLGEDTLLCAGDSLVLNASFLNSTYLWQDNSTDSTYTVYQSGTYWVQVSNGGGLATDTIEVSFNAPPTIQLESDTLFCDETSVTLDASFPGANYLWNDGTQNSTLVVSLPGLYSVQVSNYCGTTLAEATVSLENCDVLIEMPNVITPNQDGLNDFFVPIQLSGVHVVNFQIFNRWGNAVYQQGDDQISWDGMSKGNLCKEGVYFWFIEYTNLIGGSHQKHGKVHLIR